MTRVWELFPQPEATFAPCRTTATTRGLWKAPRDPLSPSARASGSGRALPREEWGVQYQINWDGRIASLIRPGMTLSFGRPTCTFFLKQAPQKVSEFSEVF